MGGGRNLLFQYKEHLWDLPWTTVSMRLQCQWDLPLTPFINTNGIMLKTTIDSSHQEITLIHTNCKSYQLTHCTHENFREHLFYLWVNINTSYFLIQIIPIYNYQDWISTINFSMYIHTSVLELLFYLKILLCHSMIAGWVVVTYRSGRGTPNLPAVIKRIWTFCTHRWQGCKNIWLMPPTPMSAYVPCVHLDLSHQVG